MSEALTPKAEVVNGHPIHMLLQVATSSEAAAARSIFTSRMVNRLAAQSSFAGEYSAHLTEALRYSAFLMERAERQIASECESAVRTWANLTGLATSLPGAADYMAANNQTPEEMQERIKTAIISGMFHGIRVNLADFWEYAKQPLGQHEEPKAMAAQLGEILTRQIALFEKVHAAFEKMEPKELPDWPTLRAKLEKERDETIAMGDDATECDCPNCTAERELDAEEGVQPKNGPTGVVAQTVH